MPGMYKAREGRGEESRPLFFIKVTIGIPDLP